MKVAWICPFETNIFAEKHDLPKTKVLAPWMTALVREFRKMNSIELHIVTPLARLKKTKTFCEEGVVFHLVPSGIPILRRGFPPWLPVNLLSSYFRLRKKISSIISKISPDIVHLHGTENNYSSAILDIQSPSVVSIQGLVHSRRESGYRSWKTIKKIRIEANILKKVNNFTVNLPTMEKIIRDYNPLARIYYSSYPINSEVFALEEISPEVDVLFAARITAEKGINDLLAAVAIIKKKWRPITVRIIGSCTNQYYNYLMKAIKELKLENCIDFIGFIEDQKEVFLHMKKAKLFVLPTHFDATPRAVSESLALGTPVIAYNVGGLHTQIEDNENGLLIQKGNIPALADAIIELLQDEDKRSRFSLNARKATSQLNAEAISKNIVGIYKEILNGGLE